MSRSISAAGACSLTLLAGAAMIGAAMTGPAVAASYATDWVAAHSSRARLIIGGALHDDGSIRRYAALEITMARGWKTYWRQPGVAGGIPPQVIWNGSRNLASADLQFPAPKRLEDPNGWSIGYKSSVVFPIALAVIDPSKPVELDLKALFGVCREICIPVEAAFKVSVPPSLFMQSPPELVHALARLPVPAASAKAGSASSSDHGSQPRVGAVAVRRAGGGRRTLHVDVVFPGGSAGGDLFAETGDYEPLAMTRSVGRPTPDTIRCEIEIEDDAQWQALGRSGLVLTMVSSAGASVARLARP